jgi:hypothetical protein
MRLVLGGLSHWMAQYLSADICLLVACHIVTDGPGCLKDWMKDVAQRQMHQALAQITYSLQDALHVVSNALLVILNPNHERISRLANLQNTRLSAPADRIDSN